MKGESEDDDVEGVEELHEEQSWWRDGAVTSLKKQSPLPLLSAATQILPPCYLHPRHHHSLWKK